MKVNQIHSNILILRRKWDNMILVSIFFLFGLPVPACENEMTIPCLECAELNTCDQSDKCKKLAKFLSVDIPKSEPVASELLPRRENEDLKDVPDIDKFRKIDRAAAFGNRESQDAVWDSESHINASDWTIEDNKAVKKYLEKGIPYGQIKLKRRFYSFLRCEKMTAIAQRANTSKQNIQQSFQRIIKRIARDWQRETRPSTPRKFKEMIAGWK
jgi:hypothetical protein